MQADIRRDALQTDKALARLLGQPDEYKDYARLWNEQRGHSIWENEDFTKRQNAAKMYSSNKKDDAAKVNILPLHYLHLGQEPAEEYGSCLGMGGGHLSIYGANWQRIKVCIESMRSMKKAVPD